MKKELDTIRVNLFGINIGIIGYDKKTTKSFFQYNNDYLNSNKYTNIFPVIFKRTNQIQVFNKYNTTTFRGLPPMIADSLPDDFGNRIFNEWMKNIGNEIKDMSPVQQLAYISNRGMGAIEYSPGKSIPSSDIINLDNITNILKEILDVKKDVKDLKLNDIGLLNIFKLGTSAGGARAKVVVSENKESLKLIPGDINFSDEYNHYLVKLNMGTDSYNREKVEYGYYLLAKEAGINMMNSKLIDDKHFATLRYDRIGGEKQHVLTATGISGLDYKDRNVSSYENLFLIANYLNLSVPNMDSLFRRMVFNYIFHNTDDHLKNHSFLYDKNKNRWKLTPAYDINYPLDALNKYLGVQHSLSLNKKGKNIVKNDLLELAEKHSISNPEQIIKEVSKVKDKWKSIANNLNIPLRVSQSIARDFVNFNSKIKSLEL